MLSAVIVVLFINSHPRSIHGSLSIMWLTFLNDERTDLAGEDSSSACSDASAEFPRLFLGEYYGKCAC